MNRATRMVPEALSVRLAGLGMLLLAALLGVALAGWVGQWWGPSLVRAEPAVIAGQVAEGGIPRPRVGLAMTEQTRGQVLFGRYCDACRTGGHETPRGNSLRSAQAKHDF